MRDSAAAPAQSDKIITMQRSAKLAAGLGLAIAGLLFSQPSSIRVQGRGASVRVPTGWKCNDKLLAAGGPISCTNFTEPYLSGGMLPTNGAEMEITSVPRPVALDTYARGELKGVRDLKLEEAPVAGRPALKASYTDEVAPGVSTGNTVFYVGQGNRLYKFYLTYRSGLLHERELMETFEAIVREAALK